MKRMLIISTGILIILTPTASLAETSLNTWKCGSTHLIKYGDSIAKVASECGEPTYKTIKEQTTTGTISGGKFITRYNETTLITEGKRVSNPPFHGFLYCVGYAAMGKSLPMLFDNLC